MKQKLFQIIKILSTILITGALGLEIGYLYLHFTDRMLPKQLDPVLSIASIALAIHLIVGSIAAFKANTLSKNFFTYGIYTFFVGFIGLWELYQTDTNTEKQT